MSLVLNVEILGEYKNLQKATEGAQSTLGKLGTKFKAIGTNIAKVVAGIGLGLGAAIASQIKPAIDAASNLNESINAVNVSFGEAAEEVLALGENAARGLGLSKNELFGISVQFSAFAKNIAGEGGDVAKIVDDISTRGADFASVYNLEVSDALAKFQSGLAGQSEPLRKFGIDLSAANVEAYALENGIGDGTGALTEQEKVLARYGSLMEQTSITQGDFANTSDSLANQQRITKATIEDLRAEIGEKLLPIMSNMMGFILQELIPAIEQFWSELTDPNGEAMKQFEAFEIAWAQLVYGFTAGSADIKSTDIFRWIGDSAISVVKALTHMGTFVSEIFGGMSKIFQAGFGLGPISQALRSAGMAQVGNAMNAAQAAADKIKFADQLPNYGAGSGETERNVNLNININRATVDAEILINEINSRLRTQGSSIQLR